MLKIQHNVKKKMLEFTSEVLYFKVCTSYDNYFHYLLERKEPIENINFQEWKHPQKLCEIYRVIKSNEVITQEIAIPWFTPPFTLMDRTPTRGQAPFHIMATAGNTTDSVTGLVLQMFPREDTDNKHLIIVTVGKS